MVFREQNHTSRNVFGNLLNQVLRIQPGFPPSAEGWSAPDWRETGQTSLHPKICPICVFSPISWKTAARKQVGVSPRHPLYRKTPINPPFTLKSRPLTDISRRGSDITRRPTDIGRHASDITRRLTDVGRRVTGISRVRLILVAA